MLKGIGYSSDMYSAYNRIQSQRAYEAGSINRLQNQNQPLLKEQQPVEETVAPKQMDLRLDSIRGRREVKLEDISLSLNDSASSFEMKGRDSDIEQLDMEKAVSDMQKDQALMQYQYFVGDSNPFMSSEDGVVITK